MSIGIGRSYASLIIMYFTYATIVLYQSTIQ